jgi:LPS sulfotransferase NodH
MQLFLPRQGPRRVIYLGRKDSTAHAISYARATLSGVWRSEQESPGSPQPEYSQSAVESARAALAGQAKAWDSMFADLNVEPLRLWYEDVFANPAEAIGRVADYLGVRIDPVAAIDVPRIDRQSQEQASEWTKLHSSGGTKGPEL